MFRALLFFIFLPFTLMAEPLTIPDEFEQAFESPFFISEEENMQDSSNDEKENPSSDDMKKGDKAEGDMENKSSDNKSPEEMNEETKPQKDDSPPEEKMDIKKDALNVQSIAEDSAKSAGSKKQEAPPSLFSVDPNSDIELGNLRGHLMRYSHQVSLQLFTFLPKKLPTSRRSFLSSVEYAFNLTSLLPVTAQMYAGRFHLRAAVGWTHGLPTYKESPSNYKRQFQEKKESVPPATPTEETKKEEPSSDEAEFLFSQFSANADSTDSKENKRKPFFSFLPAPLTSLIGLEWEMSYFNHIIPTFGWAMVFINPLKNEELKSKNYFKRSKITTNRYHLFTLGLIFSFNIFNSTFSDQMQEEYDIMDMGLFVKYQRYTPTFSWNSPMNIAWAGGFFMKF